jgi:uncharacterized protein
MVPPGGAPRGAGPAGGRCPTIAFALAFVIILAGAAAQAATGFGFSLVAVPLLAATTDPRSAVVGVSLVSPLLTVAMTVRERASVRWRTTALLLGAALLGIPLGLLLLRGAPERVLTALIAVVALACTLLVWRGLRLGGGIPTVGVVGVLTGVLSTSTGTSGPPVVAAFQAMGYDRHTFRATLAAVFTGTGAASLLGFVLAGQVRPTAVGMGLAGLPAVALGWWLGNRIFARIDPVWFRRVVLIGLALSSAVTLTRALMP